MLVLVLYLELESCVRLRGEASVRRELTKILRLGKYHAEFTLMLKHIPAAAILTAIGGKVHNNKLRRPNLSMA